MVTTVKGSPARDQPRLRESGSIPGLNGSPVRSSRAWPRVLPDRGPAPTVGEKALVPFGGRHPMDGNFVTCDLIASGSGASARSDGVGVIETDAPNSMNLPADAMDMETPIRLHRVALRVGSGGPDQFGGSQGTAREYEALTDNVTFTIVANAISPAPAACLAEGTGAGRVGDCPRRWDRGDHSIPGRDPADARRPPVVKTAGGSGFGDPGRRRGLIRFS